jgi:hypothetical protein
MPDSHLERDRFTGTERLPIVLGVTGHREYPKEDADALRTSVQDVIDKIREIAPHSGEALLVLTSLAEGADRLVAEWALNEGIPVQVVLPMAQHEFEKDFETPESLKEFRTLLTRASTELGSFPPVIAETIFTATEEAQRAAGHLSSDDLRRACYRSQGKMISRHCQILVALWDGKDSPSDAGTSAMVRYATRRDQQHFGANPRRDPADRAWVAHVWTRRKHGDLDTQRKPIVPGKLCWIAPDWHGLRPSAARLDTLDDITADCCTVVVQIDRLNRDLAKSRPRRSMPGHPHSSETWGAAWADRVGSVASYWQRERDRIFQMMLWMGIGGFALLQAYAHVFVQCPHLLLGFFVMTLVAWNRLRYHTGRSHENRHLDYRCLAEGLRVQRVLIASGLEGDVSNLYPNRREPCMDWIRAALRTLDLLGRRYAMPVSAPTDLQTVFDTAGGWISEQLRYFNDAITRLDRRRREWTRFAAVCFGMGLATAVVLLVMQVSHLVEPHATNWGFMVLLASLVMTVGAAVEVYTEQMALFETAREYRRIREIFLGYRAEFEDLVGAKDLPGLLGMLDSLAREALAENAAWVSLHRSRHPKIRVGG